MLVIASWSRLANHRVGSRRWVLALGMNVAVVVAGSSFRVEHIRVVNQSAKASGPGAMSGFIP
jgi:hypothetical protein